MNHLKPIELLTERLNEYKKALEKSKESFANGSITEEVHATHFRNLNSLIFDYNKAIIILKNKL